MPVRPPVAGAGGATPRRSKRGIQNQAPRSEAHALKERPERELTGGRKTGEVGSQSQEESCKGESGHMPRGQDDKPEIRLGNIPPQRCWWPWQEQFRRSVGTESPSCPSPSTRSWVCWLRPFPNSSKPGAGASPLQSHKKH